MRALIIALALLVAAPAFADASDDEPYHRAFVALAEGRIEAARAELSRWLAENPSAPERPHVEALLARIRPTVDEREEASRQVEESLLLDVASSYLNVIGADPSVNVSFTAAAEVFTSNRNCPPNVMPGIFKPIVASAVPARTCSRSSSAMSKADRKRWLRQSPLQSVTRAAAFTCALLPNRC